MLDGDYAYLAAGDGGLVIVDIGDPTAPRVVSRVTGEGYVYDIDVNGRVVYLALGERGIVTVDVADPENPVVTAGMEALGQFTVTSVLSGTIWPLLLRTSRRYR